MKASVLSQKIDKNLRLKNGNIAVKFQDVIKLIEFPETILHPRSWVGSARYISLREGYFGETCNGLRKLGIDFEIGNDAPRGGKVGDFIRLTKKGKSQVKQYAKEAQAIYAEIARHEAEKVRIAKIEHAARLEKITNFLVENKKRFEELINHWAEKKAKDAERSAAWSLSGREGEFSLKGETIRDIIDAWEIVKTL
jgi:hypothetical protein